MCVCVCVRRERRGCEGGEGRGGEGRGCEGGGGEGRGGVSYGGVALEEVRCVLIITSYQQRDPKWPHSTTRRENENMSSRQKNVN